MTLNVRLINRLIEMAKTAPDADRDVVIQQMRADMTTSRIWLDQAQTRGIDMPWDIRGD